MGGAASLIPGASSIPDKIDIDSFRTLSGMGLLQKVLSEVQAHNNSDKFTQEVFDSLKDENGFIFQSVLVDVNTVYLRLPRFKGVIPIYRKCLFIKIHFHL